MSEQRRGLLLGAAAFGLWGLFPLYWPLLEPADAFEILGHRIAWSLIVVAVLLVASRRLDQLRLIWTHPRVRWAMLGASIVIAVNWATYIWGVNNDHVVETSLGYYINPLVTVLLGVVILKEELRPWQWAALGVAFVAVLVLSVQLGRPPWISLILAFSFGMYGLLKKAAAVGPIEGVTFETLVLAPFAIGFLAWLSYADRATAWSHGVNHLLLLATTGFVTAVPLLCFAGSANRISLSTLGLLQYIAPTLQFAVGAFLYSEPMPPLRWVGFGLVWLALVVLTVESLTHFHRGARGAVYPGVEAVEAGVVLDEECLSRSRKSAVAGESVRTP